MSTLFDGATFKPSRDEVRLTGQLLAVYELMRDGRWRTLPRIRASMDRPYSEAGISARLRDLRKDKFGGHNVERRNVEGGLWEYRIAP